MATLLNVNKELRLKRTHFLCSDKFLISKFNCNHITSNRTTENLCLVTEHHILETKHVCLVMEHHCQVTEYHCLVTEHSYCNNLSATRIPPVSVSFLLSSPSIWIPNMFRSLLWTLNVDFLKADSEWPWVLRN